MSDTDVPDPLARLLVADDELGDEVLARLLDLIYALGDAVADTYADRIQRHYRHRREQVLALQPEVDVRQLELFPADLLAPF